MALNKYSSDFIYVIRCALNDTAPIIEDIDMDILRTMSFRQSLSCLAGHAILRAKDDDFFKKAINSNLKKTILFDLKREEIFKFMDENDIWHMALKGVFLKDLYPVYGLREMADNDILFDSKKDGLVKEFFKKDGFKVESYRKSNHDIYTKEPFYNFEMHTSLFGETHGEKLYRYYRNVKEDRLERVGKTLEYRFNPSDFYIYFMCHLIKHLRHGGIGLRFYVDTYLYLTKKKDEIDRGYIDKEFRKLGIYDDAVRIEEISLAIFNPEYDDSKLLPWMEETLRNVTFTSTYGDQYTYIKNSYKEIDGEKISRKTRRKYLLNRLFPPIKNYKRSHPFLYKTVIFIPFFYFYRILKALFTKMSIIRNEVRLTNEILIEKEKEER